MRSLPPVSSQPDAALHKGEIKMSSSTEDHPLIAEARLSAPELEGKGRDEFYQKASIELALLAPQQRTAVIQQVSKALHDDESTDLRKKAQLVALKRHLNITDATLKRAGR
jgi:hypothetical protein